jgi:DNA modification methylase
MQIETVGIGSVIPYARNPRRNDAAISKVAASLQEFGWRQPIVVDDDMVVVVGHTRLEAARSLGMGEVPIHVAAGLTPEQIKAYRLADNRVGEEAEWDHELLRLELGELEGMDFSLDLTGFDSDELLELMADPFEEGQTDPDDVPELPEEAITKPGDLWLLGQHRLLCGDSTNADDVAKCLNGVEPHLMVTDPPYGVEYDPNQRSRVVPNAAKRTYMPAAEDTNRDWGEVWVLFPGDVCYVWHSDKQIIGVGTALQSSGFDLRQQIIWAKNHLTITRTHFHYQHEHCWYGVRKGANGHWSGPTNETTLWKIDKVPADTGHGAQKPVECMKRPIENNSSIGQAVYDPFLGSGTTMIAAEMTGRACHGLEISPEYCDVIVQRWENFTGRKAELDS